MNSTALNNWNQEGKLYIWHYANNSKRSYGGLHLSSDKLSTDNILQLFSILKIHDEGKRTINLTKTTDKVASVNGYNRRYEYYSKVKLNYNRDHIGISVNIDGSVLMINIGSAGVIKLTDALEKYKKGEYDFSVKSEIRGGTKNDNSIWFW
ncbi:hypothetical protein [endosymbiont of Lamellibrachia barhami]|uniref:hypothetical protein n=1 Tax=endosymbiont of Lamellibrachia barhami TaxID=205975 RepID=UPI0015AE4F37|nr:hypothetical protein [endosymbiont of Lamellibrachia barhami]